MTEKYSTVDKKIIDGLSTARKIRESIKQKVATITATDGQRAPSICFIRVGNDPASKIYVDAKKKACEEVGITSKEIHITEEDENDITANDISEQIKKLNNDKEIDAILLQLPLPRHIQKETDRLLSMIDPEKDVDGLHPINVGKLWNGDDTGFIPCTPKGIMTLLKKYDINPEGRNTVVIGRSRLVGKPIAALLLRENATVTIAHSRTNNIKEICQNADILVCAVGKAELVKTDWIKNNAIVIDVGINRIEGSECCEIVGDVAFESAKAKAKLITPVPGGVGPMTIASLLENVLKAFRLRHI